MNKKDIVILARLEKQVAELKNQSEAHHKRGNRALYISPLTLAISFIASGLVVLLSSLSPIAAAMPLLIAGILAIVYIAWELCRQQQEH